MTTRPIFFTDCGEMHQWLAQHHASSGEVVVGFYKAGSTKRGITYDEALDEALSVGWIDGVRKSIDETRWQIRFTPRKARSKWSAVNIERANQLAAEGRMQAAGLAAFEARVASSYSYESRPAAFTPELAESLVANALAHEYWLAQPPSYRRTVTHWIMSAKQAETRARRFEKLLDLSAKGRRLDAK